jgi:hypothetical protein
VGLGKWQVIEKYGKRKWVMGDRRMWLTSGGSCLGTEIFCILARIHPTKKGKTAKFPTCIWEAIGSNLDGTLTALSEIVCSFPQSP